MYPRHFRDTFWDVELEPRVFVAIAFREPFETRFERVIAPAISDTRLLPAGTRLQPFRVDLSKKGDSIISEIARGILRSRLVLADVSTEHYDRSGRPYRNGNVMYEVGLALAWRDPHHVLIIRGDDDEILFDVSTIPHRRINFDNEEVARAELREALTDRLMVEDIVCREQMTRTWNRLTSDDIRILQIMGQRLPHPLAASSGMPARHLMALRALIDMQAVRSEAVSPGNVVNYHLTRLGKQLALALLPLAEQDGTVQHE